MTALPVVNTHVHVPPNFSPFDSVADLVASARAEGVRALGVSNFYDTQVYDRFAAQARAAGIVPLFGCEFITLDDALQAEGVRVNDPANPGRVYFCGKGIDPHRSDPVATVTAARVRSGNDERAHAMMARLAAWFDACGIAHALSAERVERSVAERAGVPSGWVSLQERHVARAVAEAIEALPAAERTPALARLFGGPARSEPTDTAALQGEIRARLLKVGTPGFVPEVPLAFSDAYAHVLALGGIPCYPILADGADPVSAWEDPPADLAARLLERRVFAAELIPNRNASAVVDAHVAALTAAGILVMGGTEHNTPDRVALDPVCADGPLSDAARVAFWQATCVVAAHQARVAAGEPGYVDAHGARVGGPEHTAELIAFGESIISGKAPHE